MPPRYPFPRPSLYTLRTRRSDTGLGLFTEEAIPRKSFVIEYWGTLVSEARANEIGGKYLFELGNGKTIDGTTRKNIARYINHSCKPNCEIDVVGNRVYVMTLRAIKAGEELTYDYGKEYFNALIKPHGCRCAACAKKKAPSIR